MTNYATARSEFISTATAEVTRAFDNVAQNGVSQYVLAQQADGSIEAFAEGVRVDGVRFWEISSEVVEGGYSSAGEYLNAFADEMRSELGEALINQE